MKLHEFPRHPLTFGPSPLQHLKRLTQHLGGAQVWAKREDVNSGLAFGGNKVRKLEYIVPDVLASGADTLVSIGGYQSNHTRQVAAVAAHLGLKARLVQEKWVPWDDPTNDKVGNILLSRMMGADSRLDDAGFDIGIRDSWKQALQEVESAGGTPYPIPAGASEHRLGGPRTRRHRSPRLAAGHGGQVRTVPQLRRTQLDPHRSRHPGSRRDRRDPHPTPPELRRREPRGHLRAALLRDRASPA